MNYSCYITDNSLALDRQGNGMEELKRTVREKWEVTDERGSSCGNIRVCFNDNKATLVDTMRRYETPSYLQISSALALYRTISLFECSVDGSQVSFYKRNWYVKLQHKETNELLALSEYKGGFMLSTPFYNVGELKATYKRDAEELLTLLVSPTMTIGYDGTVAGTVRVQDLQKNVNYITDQSLVRDVYDSTMEEQKRVVKAKWEVCKEKVSTSGNIRAYFNDNKATLDETSTVSGTVSYEQISSALALYRTISLFECGVNKATSDFYKVNWSVLLKHKETSDYLALTEWKGGFSISTPFQEIGDLKAAYKRDAEELLTLLVSPTMTIGYDDLVAGTVD